MVYCIVMDVVHVVMSYLVIISDATDEYLPGDNEVLLNWIESNWIELIWIEQWVDKDCTLCLLVA